MNVSDAELLRRYAEEHSEAAFAGLVQRHVNLVYAAALRRLGGDAHLAQDVAQQVFTALARDAKSLSRRAVLAGWLYTATRFASAQVVRGERRRRAREEEAQTMQELSSAEPVTEGDWQRLRPLLDGAMDTLNDRDREAVLLRFFEGLSFGEIAAALQLSHDAARMRVDRALDKLHGVLAQRGVKSTAAALGLALANQAGVAAPATLAASITGVVLAGAAAGAGATAAGGLFALVGSSKVVAGVCGSVALIAGGVAVTEHQRGRDAAITAAAAEQRQRDTQGELATVRVRLAQAERRAAEAEKDNGELLKAVEDLKTQQAARAQRSAANPTTGGRSPEEDERLVFERAHQQELARVRVQEAIARAKVDEEASRLDPTRQFERLIEAAEEYLGRAEFQSGIRIYNYAMGLKPADVPVTERIKKLQAALMAQNVPIMVPLISDGNTWVSIVNSRAPSKFTATTYQTLPGNYQIMGRRKGYRDVAVPLQLRAGMPLAPITVICDVSAQ